MAVVTSKDLMRMNRLIEYTQSNGLMAGAEKAERDAVKIETVAKCEARAQILIDRGYRSLANAFLARKEFLNANGVF